MAGVFDDILQPREEAAADERPLTVVLTTGGALNALLREQGVAMRADGGDVVCDLTPQARIFNAAEITESTFVQVKVFAQRVEVAPVPKTGDLTAAVALDLDELEAWAANSLSPPKNLPSAGFSAASPATDCGSSTKRKKTRLSSRIGG